MRISFLSVSDQLGGSEAALLAMLQGLRAVRPAWQAQVILPGGGPLMPRVLEAGATVAVVPMPGALARLGESAAMRRGWGPAARVAFITQVALAGASVPRYQREVERALAVFQPDVVHTNGIKAHVIGARLARPGRSLVWHLHEYVSPRRFTRRSLERYARRCDAVIANSKSVADDAAPFVGQDRLHVVHNAVDLRRFSPAGDSLDLDALAGLPARPAIRLGLIATFSRWKGHEVFVNAMRTVANRAPGTARGYLVGDALYDTSGSQYTRAELEGLIAARGLQHDVGLTGFADAAAVMRSLDVVVHASTQPEPFGLVVAEAMACGRAVVTTASGGTGEFVEDGRTVLVAAAGDSDTLAAAMLRLIHEPHLRAALGSMARAAAVERFGPERLGTQLADIYERAVARRVAA